MGGGLLQLVAYGAQDAYISGNPHITFWKVMYKRHTNFAMEAFRVNFTGSPHYGQRVVAVINRNADLMYKTYLEVVLPDTTAATGGIATGDVHWTGDAQRRLGYAMLKKIEVEIGGQIIDTHYGEWLYLWENLTSSFDNSSKLDQMVGGPLSTGTSSVARCNGRPGILYIPLQFWFCRNPGLALPLIALQYHEVRINITLAAATDLVAFKYADPITGQPLTTNYSSVSSAGAALPQLKDMALYIDYVYLDTEERRRFAQQSHEYLIDQLQFGLQQTITSAQARIDLTLNHPVKELIWVFQNSQKTDCGSALTAATGYTQQFSYDDIVDRCRLQINGQDRFDERYGDYFWKVQPYQHHTGGAFFPTRSAYTFTPYSGGGATGVDPLQFQAVNPVNVYSFAIQPEEHQPSGTCNFSRIDTATLVFDSITTGGAGTFPSKANPYNFRIYAVNYNIFRVMSGMGGLAYSN
jgi:hypothetical protein